MQFDVPEAIVLAGGQGTRLAPYTMAFPKPLVPLHNLPIIEIVLRQLSWYGIKKVHLSVGYLASLIEAYFVTRGPLSGIDIGYLRESEPLGTAGAIRLLETSADQLLVVNGDVLTTLNFSSIMDFHRDQNSALTIGVHRKEVKIDLGVLEVDADSRVTDYREKPTSEHFCSMGVYVYSKSAVEAIEPGERLDFPDLVLRLIEAGRKVVAFHSDCYWLDIGRREDYEKAAAEFSQMRQLLLPDEEPQSEFLSSKLRVPRPFTRLQ